MSRAFSLTRTNAPAAEPISLDEVKAHLGIVHDFDDAMLGTLIASAVASLDGWNGRLGRAMIGQDWRMVVDRFPYGALDLPMSPVLAIVGVGYVGADGDDVAFNLADYRGLDLATRDGARVAPAAGKVWASVPSDANGVYVDFRAGYGETPDDVPADLRHALLAMVGTAYAARESVNFLQTTLRPVDEIEAAIDRHRVWRVG